MSEDLAEIAYEAWAGHLSQDPVSWDELTDEQTRPWIAVERRFVELRDGDPDPGPDSVDFTLEFPPPEIRDDKGRSLAGTKARKRASRFAVRRPTAADLIEVQGYATEERDLRLAFTCMKPTPSNSRFAWGDFEEYDAADILEAKAVILDDWRSIEGHLYEAWREPGLLAIDLEIAELLHPEDAADFIEFERENKNRAEVIAVLERRAAAEPGDEERWYGRVAFTIAPDWRDVVLSDSPVKRAWFQVSLNLARACEGEAIALFTPGVRRTLAPKIDRIRGKELLAMRGGANDEERMLALASCLCGVSEEELLKLSVDDFMRVALTAQQEWLPNRTRERERSRGSRGGKQTSPASPTASEASSPSP